MLVILMPLAAAACVHPTVEGARSPCDALIPESWRVDVPDAPEPPVRPALPDTAPVTAQMQDLVQRFKDWVSVAVAEKAAKRTEAEHRAEILAFYQRCQARDAKADAATRHWRFLR